MKQIMTMCRILQDNIPFSAQDDELNSRYFKKKKEVIQKLGRITTKGYFVRYPKILGNVS